MIWFNIISFYAVWFACVYSGVGACSEIYSVLFGILLVIYHLYKSQNLRLQRLKIILFVTILGVVFDSIPVYLGYVTFPSTKYFIGIYPFWMTVLWSVFATTFWLSLNWMIKNKFYCLLLGGLGGPASFYAAFKIGSLNFPLGTETALIINGLEWGVLLIIFSFLFTQAIHEAR